MRKRELITIRPGEEGDRPFIYSTRLKGLRYANKWLGLIDEYLYFNEYHKVIDRILHNPKTEIRIATLITDPEIILGYSVQENSTLHWVFIKPDWRNIGLARDLVGDKITTITHQTKKGAAALKHQVNFDPTYWIDYKKE